jgi:crotonobetaine/carnitine-CoA ligase
MYEGRAWGDTVWSLLERRSALDGDRPLITFLEEGRPDELSSWASIKTRAERLAGQLHGAGVQPDGKVALFGLNSLDYLVALFGVARLGATLVPLNAMLTPAEIAWQLKDSGAAALISEVEGVACMDQAADTYGWSGPRIVLRGTAAGWETPGETHFANLAKPTPDGVFEILYTSGTTARPKGVMLSHRSIAIDASDIAALWAARGDDAFLGVLPLFHVNAQMVTLFPALTVGARLVLCRAFSAGGWIDTVRRYGVTISSIVGTQVRMIMATPARPDDADTDLRCVPYGLNVPREMWDGFERRFGAPLVNIYGLTEAIAIASATPLAGDRRIPSVGRPARGKRIAILDSAGRDVPAGEPGEICVQAPVGVGLMVGYHGNPEATAQAIRDRWLHTGDIGTMDEDGYLYFVDRAKDIIKRGGENVSAGEVERVLTEHPSVLEATVVGRPDPVRDEAVVAFVILKPGATADLDDLDAHCRANLARFKVPSEVRVVADLPRTSVGKVEKKTLRQILQSETVPAEPSTVT